MDFPPAWTVLTSEEYETATPRITGDVSMEICAQLRPSGRILDNFRVSLGGSKILEYEADLGQFIPIPFFKGWRVKGKCWARDVAIRANIFSSGWIDLAATVGMREMEVFDKDGASIPPGEFLRILNELNEDEPNAASFRFAVVVGEDNLPPVSLTPVANLPPVSTAQGELVHLNLRISPRIFEKIRNSPNGILWGWGETDS
jgi:hypothetical protein